MFRNRNMQEGDVWIQQDSGGDLEFFVWQYAYDPMYRQCMLSKVSHFHPTYESALVAADKYVAQRPDKRRFVGPR